MKSIRLTLKSGSLSRFMQVEAVGSLSRSGPELAMQKGGYKSWEWKYLDEVHTKTVYCPKIKDVLWIWEIL